MDDVEDDWRPQQEGEDESPQKSFHELLVVPVPTREVEIAAGACKRFIAPHSGPDTTDDGAESAQYNGERIIVLTDQTVRETHVDQTTTDTHLKKSSKNTEQADHFKVFTSSKGSL